MRREVYERPDNEIEQQMARHNLERDMAQDYAASTRVLTKEEARNHSIAVLGIGVFLILLLVCFGLVVWLY